MITIFNINKIHGIKANCRRAGVFRRELCNAYRKSQVQDDTKQTPEQCYLSVPEKPLWEYARTRGERSFRLFILHSMKKKKGKCLVSGAEELPAKVAPGLLVAAGYLGQQAYPHAS